MENSDKAVDSSETKDVHDEKSNEDDDEGKDADELPPPSKFLKLQHNLDEHQQVPGHSFRVDIALKTDLLTENFKNKLRFEWDNGLANNTNIGSDIILYNEPFKLCVIEKFLQKSSVIRNLLSEIVGVTWSRKQMDLYEFYQSTDLSNAQSSYLRGFYEFLKNNVMPWMENITGIKLNHVSASCSMYNTGDYLLVHDDLLTNRLIAFVFYISPWKGVESWTTEMGGCLEVFDTNENNLPSFPVKRKISPKNNQFVFFKVGSKSFHQVGEVTCFDYPRLTINGWFHGAVNIDVNQEITRTSIIDFFMEPVDSAVDLSEWIQKIYLDSRMKRNIQNHVEETSEICLEEYLLPSVYEKIKIELETSTTLHWHIKSPANAQKFELLDLNDINGEVKKFIELFCSTKMFALLQEYTNLDLAGPNASEPKYTIEIQRWSPGCYTVLGDSTSQQSDASLDLIFYINAADNVGIINYLAPESDDDDNSDSQEEDVGANQNYIGQNADDSVLLTIPSKPNALNVVYRTIAKYRLFASLAFILVVIVIGVPMWWTTTKVYRASLSDVDINSLDATPLKISVKIGFYMRDPVDSVEIIKRMKENVQNETMWDLNFFQIQDIDNPNASVPQLLEKSVLKKFPLSEGDFLFMEWPKLEEEILLTTGRSAFIRRDTTHSKLQYVLRYGILQIQKIQPTFDDTNRMDKSPPVKSKYDILLSVINTRPEMLDVKWNIHSASNLYIKPYLKSITYVSNYTLRTQWRYQSRFDFPVKQVKDNTKIGRHYLLEKNIFPHLITTIEKNLGNSITDNHCIHLVVYIPPCDISPLRLHKLDEKVDNPSFDKIESFISPGWGGVTIYNPPVDLCIQYNENQKKVSFVINSKDVMEVALYHIGQLLDMHTSISIDGVKMNDVGQLAPRSWEYDAFIRRAAANHITTAIHTLTSLNKLLGDINYIVINDDVAKSIISACENILQAKVHLKSNELLLASKYAQEAYTASEKAFFDASLLEQLYFPDDQKYAVYIPLFLPVMVPVITSLAMIRKNFVNINKKTKLKTT